MSRNRMIKPEFWDDEKIATIKRDSRLTFIALWNLSDDYGVVKGNSVWLKNRIFPYDDKLKLSEFETWLNEIIEIKAIYPFNNNGESYYYIKNFLTHQKINRPSEKRNPEPPNTILEDSLNTHGGIIESSCPKLKEEKLKEEKLKEENGDPPFVKIISYLNKKSGKKFQPTADETKRLITARWNQGYKLEDFQKVIDNKCGKWLIDPKMIDYIRPQTLFGTKFESYLNEKLPEKGDIDNADKYKKIDFGSIPGRDEKT